MKNERFITNQMSDIGYSAKEIDEVREAMAHGQPGISKTFSKDTEEGRLVTRPVLTKGSEGDFYFFNKYRATLLQPGVQDVKEVMVYVNKSHNYTLDEVSKMLKGGALEKELLDRNQKPYVGWSAVDSKEVDKDGFSLIKSRHPNYGFVLSEAAEQFAIKDFKDDTRRLEVFDRLKKGELVRVTGADDKTYFIAPNPKFKTLDIYDDQARKLSMEQRMELRVDGMKEGEKHSNAARQEAKKGMGV